MQQRYMAIWFPTLLTDWKCIKHPEFKGKPLVFADKVGNRMVITSCSREAAVQGIFIGMPLADARAIMPELEVIENQSARAAKILYALGTWSIRYTPLVAIEDNDSLTFNISGCAHLWGGERAYLKTIVNRLRNAGYFVRAAIADTIGTAWAVSRYGTISPIIKSGEELDALFNLPPMALRLDQTISNKLIKLGLTSISKFISMPRSVLRRRIGEAAMERIEQVLGQREEPFNPIKLQEPYSDRLASMEPIRTRKGIEIAIEKLLSSLCKKLSLDGFGIRSVVLQSFRVDGKRLQTTIGTNSPSVNLLHLVKLFNLKIDSIEPKMGIELFVMNAYKVEPLLNIQEALWQQKMGSGDNNVAELLDRLAGKVGHSVIHRFLPQAHHWPERSIKMVSTLHEMAAMPWRKDLQRPVQLLPIPESIQVTAPIPDYPPMVFRYQGIVHQVKKADGPERIEREWWLDKGEHRDYYQVEDEAGKRYWLFRSGHYQSDKKTGWYIHGFFA